MASPFGIPPVEYTSAFKLATKEVASKGVSLPWTALETYCTMGVPGAKRVCREKRQERRHEMERQAKADARKAWVVSLEEKRARQEERRVLERAQWKERRAARNERRSANRRRRRSADNYRKQITRNKRERVYARDGYRCVKCGAGEDLSLDHIKPVLLGGTNAVENLQTMCRPCNGRKGNRWDPATADMRASVAA